MSHNAPYKFWNPEVGKTYRIRFLDAAPSYDQHWIKPDNMTPDQRHAKMMLDEISGSKPTISWADIRDTRFAHTKPYTMPGTSLPAFRYTYITGVGQRATKEVAAEFERKMRVAGYPVRAQAHLTRSGSGSYYWKVETFVPRQMFRSDR